IRPFSHPLPRQFIFIPLFLILFIIFFLLPCGCPTKLASYFFSELKGLYKKWLQAHWVLMAFLYPVFKYFSGALESVVAIQLKQKAQYLEKLSNRQWSSVNQFKVIAPLFLVISLIISFFSSSPKRQKNTNPVFLLKRFPATIDSFCPVRASMLSRQMENKLLHSRRYSFFSKNRKNYNAQNQIPSLDRHNHI